jgi:hypothetical protein
MKTRRRHYKQSEANGGGALPRRKPSPDSSAGGYCATPRPRRVDDATAAHVSAGVGLRHGPAARGVDAA